MRCSAALFVRNRLTAIQAYTSSKLSACIGACTCFRFTCSCFVRAQASCSTLSNTLVALCRTNDGSQQWAQFRFAPINTVGAYQPTPNQTAALYPQLAGTTPWILPQAATFVPQQFANLTYAPVRLVLRCTLKNKTMIREGMLASAVRFSL